MAKFLGLLALAGLTFCVYGQNAEFTIHFDRTDLTLSKVTKNGQVYDVVSLLGTSYVKDPGKPRLPQQMSHAVLPPTATQVRVELVTLERERLPGSYSILPAQPPRALVSDTETPFVEPDSVVYSVSTPYPRDVVTVSMGHMGGYRVAGLIIRPVQYVPSDGTLYFHSTIRFRLVWSETAKSLKPQTRSQNQTFARALRSTVLNPQDVDRYSPPVMPAKDEEECDYLIITSPALTSASDFDPKLEEIRKELIVTPNWSDKEFGDTSRRLKGYQYAVDIQKIDLVDLSRFLTSKNDLLLRLLENPVLLEHESFSELLRAVSHLTEELEAREDLGGLPESDLKHLAGDTKRAYNLLVHQWLAYMKYLKSSYPYLFSLAVRTNPFDRSASPVVK